MSRLGCVFAASATHQMLLNVVSVWSIPNVVIMHVRRRTSSKTSDGTRKTNIRWDTPIWIFLLTWNVQYDYTLPKVHKQQSLAVVITPCNRMLLSFSCAIPSPSAHVLLNQPIPFACALHNFYHTVPDIIANSGFSVSTHLTTLLNGWLLLLALGTLSRPPTSHVH